MCAIHTRAASHGRGIVLVSSLVRLSDSGLPPCIQRDARIAFDIRAGIVSVTRETLISEMIVWIILKTQRSSTFEQEDSFTRLRQQARGDTATRSSATDNALIPNHSW